MSKRLKEFSHIGTNSHLTPQAIKMGKTLGVQNETLKILQICEI